MSLQVTLTNPDGRVARWNAEWRDRAWHVVFSDDGAPMAEAALRVLPAVRNNWSARSLTDLYRGLEQESLIWWKAVACSDVA